jgi:MFS family permease
MTTPPLDRSYRSLFAVPLVGRLLAGMQIARIAQSMVSVTIVLFTLTAYRSAALTGIVTFFGVFPGLAVSPIAGALLDRHGRRRLVVLDYLVALVSLTLLGLLVLASALPAWLLILIAAIASLTAPLSNTGLRTFFPLIVPSHLWERANAVDSTGYILATIVGPPVAAGLVAAWGGAVAFIAIGLTFGVAAIITSGIPDPPLRADSNKPLLHEARDGLLYTCRHPTLRGLGFSISTLNLASGCLNIIVPFLVIQRLHLPTTLVGLVIAVHGLTGVISAFFAGRYDSRNRERMMLTLPMLGVGLAIAMLLLRSDLLMLVLVMALTGLLNGPLDIALFTLRQRRTDPAWTGRAFAVSMAFNSLGLPLGSAFAGFVAERSIEAAIGLGVVAALSASFLAATMIPENSGSD